MRSFLCWLLNVAFLVIMVPIALAEEPSEPILLPPSPPGQVTVSGIQETRATVSWAPVPSATQYTVWVNGHRWSGSTHPSAEITGLQPYTDYTVWVTAANDAGESGYSQTVTFKTLPPAPNAPDRPVVREVTGTKAIIEWHPLPVWQHIQCYRIYVDGQAVADVDPQEGIHSAELVNLEAGIHYVAVSGINENQEGPTSRPAQFIIQALSAPTGLTIANRSHDRVLVTWDAVPDADRYKVYLDGNVVGEVKTNTYIVEGLTAETGYRVGVQAVLGDGNESVMATLGIQTPPQPPGMTLDTVMDSTYEYIPDVAPVLVIIFVIGAAMKIARTGKLTVIGRQFLFRRY